MICPVIKDDCTACDVVDGKPYCEVLSAEIHKGDQCPDDEEE